MKHQNTLGGIITPLVTPLLAEDSLDQKGLDALIEHVLGGGVRGIFLLGTTGEGPSLSYRLRHEVVQRVCQHVSGRAPLLIGVTDTAITESLALARTAVESGADYLVLAPPYYSPMNQPDLMDYIRRLVPRLPLPVMLYNIPGCTKTAFHVETVRRLADLPGVIGLKDSSGDMIYFYRLLEAFSDRPEFPLLLGPEEPLVSALMMGAHGAICGGSNLYPHLYTGITDSVALGDFEKARELHSLVLKVRDIVFAADFGGYYLKGLKYALAQEGLCSGFMAEPFTSLVDEAGERLAGDLKDLTSEIAVTLLASRQSEIEERTAGVDGRGHL